MMSLLLGYSSMGGLRISLISRWRWGYSGLACPSKRQVKDGKSKDGPKQLSWISTWDITRLFIDNKEMVSETNRWLELRNPSTNEPITRVPCATHREIQMAVDVAQRVYPIWRETSIFRRRQLMLGFRSLFQSHMNSMAHRITLEQGKTLHDAHAELDRGLEAIDHACSVASILLGETATPMAGHIEVETFREPLGVCLGVTPFNFPAMLPLWMFPMALVCGNTFVLKPSERCPGVSMYMANLIKESGFLPGVFNVVHGDREIVDHLCDSSAIRAISFVGSEQAGRHVYIRGTALGKRVQANLSAKNHGIIMPDADRQQTLDQLIGAAFGSAGQRCMALPVAVFVGETSEWIPDLIERARSLRIADGFDSHADMGPMISSQAKQRVFDLIEKSIKQGAKILLDGRQLFSVSDHLVKGNFLGPTLLTDIAPHMDCYREEVFGPVLLCIRVGSFEEAIKWIQDNPFGNAAAIFTRSAETARRFRRELDVGQVGVNVAIPVPPAALSFTGSRGSFLGDLNFQGKTGVQFYTQIKTVMSRWIPHPSGTENPEKRNGTPMHSSSKPPLSMPTLH